jgi:hypothetical protein
MKKFMYQRWHLIAFNSEEEEEKEKEEDELNKRFYRAKFLFIDF